MLRSRQDRARNVIKSELPSILALGEIDAGIPSAMPRTLQRGEEVGSI
jgi:hypothetical protein